MRGIRGSRLYDILEGISEKEVEEREDREEANNETGSNL